MELHRKAVPAGVLHALAGAVVGIFEYHPSQPGKALRIHGIAVVLAGYKSSGSVQLPYRLVYAPVTVFELVGAAARMASASS
jgi:hypothetical protein